MRPPGQIRLKEVNARGVTHLGCERSCCLSRNRRLTLQLALERIDFIHGFPAFVIGRLVVSVLHVAARAVASSAYCGSGMGSYAGGGGVARLGEGLTRPSASEPFGPGAVFLKTEPHEAL